MSLLIGYAVAKKSYEKYKAGEDPLVSSQDILKNGFLDPNSNYTVISCREWDAINAEFLCDAAVPVGRVRMHVTVSPDGISKDFAVPAGEKLFSVIRVVLFSEKMSLEEFQQNFACTVSPPVGMGESLVRGESAEISVKITRKVSPESLQDENRPVEFRNVGLTCYMNTALQVLLGVSELSDAVLQISQEEIREFAARKNTRQGYDREKCGVLLQAYKALVKTARRRGDCLGKLKEIKRALGSIDPRYRGCSEEDAGEVFSLILNNFNYLFEKTPYESLIPDLFVYTAESVRVLRSHGEVVGRKVKPLYRSFVLNGSFGSEGGPHGHVLVIHRNQLITTGLCLYQGKTVGEIRESVSRKFQEPVWKVLAVQMEGERIRKVPDAEPFSFRKNLLEQSFVYVTDEALEDAEFLFISYTPGIEGLSFLASFFSGVKNVFQIPFLVRKKCNIAQFLGENLKIKRRTDVPNTVLEIKHSREETEEYFGSMVVALTNKYWDAAEHIESIKNRKYEVRDCVHVQCVVSNWESPSRERREEEGKEVEEFTRFRGFSKYFCVQLPVGLGKGGEKFDRQKFFVEKEGLVLDGAAYSLVGILVHHSFGIGGHYVAFTRRGGMWYHCNDSSITKSSANDAASTGYPYGILYRRADP
ncbi:uncharacterized protein NEMAJ01_1835 [Nematocida major]|uniref:uncharacterized protein n=1 Tax=Nematocida major TaxID=1912982 RepID=UPI0020072351|nr:uncharacterized protein NEMAJ01_1835 [Nematocida major]KAH9386939.1 hypothetical protein NEMAJ01_1835 [Nematocida major]